MCKARIEQIAKSDKGFGLIILVGITDDNSEFFNILQPTIPILNFYYKCDKSFNIEYLSQYFIELPSGFVIFINGDKCIIYEFNNVFKKLKAINANLINRQRKGGQSSVRFSRLAEESRHHYVVHCIDYINKFCKESNNNYIFGSKEIKNMLLTNNNLNVKLKEDNTCDFSKFDDNSINNPYFLNLMKNSGEDNEDKYNEELLNLISTNPDILLFSQEEIEENKEIIDYIMTTQNECNYPNSYRLKPNSKYYSRLKDYQYIAKLYYAIN